ncbi:urease accessory protein UreF [Streptomyces malaysiensis subsp. malaysiensis]|uniref:urease accessory protein UreF n=1 Tax=Streptomyces malaysiensis TaxID=92644 RepID=UPI00115F733A|nr:urease accessory UreF family protein [Streptomyces malaysiensis]QDL69425.1 urease accessory protein UreF [Streptomyces malaysiensis]
MLILADGRFPAGGHAHSGGAEAAVAAGRIHDAASLEAFCRGRLHTAGLTAAGLAAAAAAGLDPLALDEAADARTPPRAPRHRPAARPSADARRLRHLAVARAGRPRRRPAARAHQAVVLGLAARAAALGPPDAAYAAGYEAVSGPATAAVRLLSLDPFDATAALARLAPELDQVVARATEAARRALDQGPGALPAASAPLLDIAAEQHATWSVRLFAS